MEYAWYAVRTSPGSEASVINALVALDCEAWAPQAVEWHLHRDGTREARSRYAWPTYALVKLEQLSVGKPVPAIFGTVLKVDGVAGFIGRDEPHKIFREGVEALQRLERYGHLDETRRGSPKKLRPSDLDALKKLWATGMKLKPGNTAIAA